MTTPVPHKIRLRGPWKCEPLERWPVETANAAIGASPLPSPGRVQMPCDWSDTLGSDFRGRARFTRKFNRPTNLGAAERVWLVIEGIVGEASLQLNGNSLPLDRGRAEITTHIQPFNALSFEIALRPEQPTPNFPICDARLEITS